MGFFLQIFGKTTGLEEQVLNFEVSLDPIGGFCKGLNRVLQCCTLSALAIDNLVVDIFAVLVLKEFRST